MAHPLQKKIRSIRRRAHSAVALYGASRTIAAVLAVALLLGLADYWIRFEDPGIRVICSLLVLAALLHGVYFHLMLPLARRLRDVNLAFYIERRFPQLGELLSSAIEFLQQPEADPQAGSAALRRAVIVEATSQVDQLDLAQVFNYRPIARALAAAGLVVAATGVLVFLDPASARTAAVRLANPASAVVWPKRNDLAFNTPPTRLASGQTFEVELLDRNQNLPERVTIFYRYQVDGQWSETESRPMQFTDGVMLAIKENVIRPFQYRAEGGDDRSMEWIDLEVVEPPRVEQFQVMLHPPEYTGYPAMASDKRIRAIQGTRIGITGSSTKPLSSAQVKLEGDEAIEAAISDDGYQFTLADADFTADKSGTYWFALTDREELTGGAETRWDLRVLPDTPPSVMIEQPGSNVFVSPDATVPLRILVKDNLAVHRVWLQYTRSDQSDQGELSLELFAGPDQVEPRPAASFTEESGESRLVEYGWNLAELNLPPGAQVAFTAHASDYLPQTGESGSARRITIISKPELEDRLAQRQNLILGELARVLKMQREARGQTTGLEVQLEEVGSLAKGDLDDLQSAELNQRQVERTLIDEQDGIPTLIRSLLADLESNKIDAPDIERRMHGLLAEIGRLAKDHLPVVRSELTSALKSAQLTLDAEGRTSDADVGRSIAVAGQSQDEVIATLERLLGDLSEWADYRRFASDIRQVQREQQDIEERTTEVGKQTLSRDLKDLAPQEKAELEKLAQRQFELARRFDKILQQMERMGEEIAERDPLAASTLDDGVQQARQDQLSGQMRGSGRQLQENKVGGAVGQQQNVARGLQELLDILANRREHELTRLVEKLKQAEEDLAGLRQQQQGLRKKMEEAAENDDEAEKKRQLERLTRQQKQLQEEIDRMARRLKRLQADRAGRSTQRGAASAGRAGEAGEQGDAGGAAEMARQAEKDLDDAQQQLAEARQKAEQDLLEEQLARFQDSVKGMLEQQQRVLEETVRLENLRQEQGQWTRAQSLSVGDVARQQGMLKDETNEYVKKFDQAEVFKLALSGAAHDMEGAEELLRRQETGPPAQRAEQNAIDRLAQLLRAFEDDEDDPADGQEEEDGGGGDGQGPQGKKIIDITQLKLLKLLQEDVNRRTARLAQEVGGQPPSDEQQQEFARLRHEQGRLADLVFDLMKLEGDDPDDPARLPDLREEDLLETLPDLTPSPHSAAWQGNTSSKLWSQTPTA